MNITRRSLPPNTLVKIKDPWYTLLPDETVGPRLQPGEIVLYLGMVLVHERQHYAVLSANAGIAFVTYIKEWHLGEEIPW